MIDSKLPIYLASSSQRRIKLLKLINLKFKTIPVNINENIIQHESPVKTVKRLANEKLEAAKKVINRGIIITADTLVSLDGIILGKPINEKEAIKFLRKLSNKTHSVYTGFAVFNSDTQVTLSNYEKTLVTFRDLNIKEIEEYVHTGSPLDKAGAYGIQEDFGAVFVKKINGCYYNVVGLPLTKLYLTLKRII